MNMSDKKAQSQRQRQRQATLTLSLEPRSPNSLPLASSVQNHFAPSPCLRDFTNTFPSTSDQEALPTSFIPHDKYDNYDFDDSNFGDNGNRNLSELFSAVPRNAAFVQMVNVTQPSDTQAQAQASCVLPYHYQIQGWLDAFDQRGPFIPPHCVKKYEMTRATHVVEHDEYNTWLAVHETMWRDLSARCTWLINHILTILFSSTSWLQNALARAACKPGSFQFCQLTFADGSVRQLHIPSEFFFLCWLEKEVTARNIEDDAPDNVAVLRDLLQPLQAFAFKSNLGAHDLLDEMMKDSITICINQLKELSRCALPIIKALLSHIVFVQDMVTQVKLSCQCGETIEDEFLFGVSVRFASTTDETAPRIVYVCPHKGRVIGKTGFSYITIIENKPPDETSGEEEEDEEEEEEEKKVEEDTPIPFDEAFESNVEWCAHYHQFGQGGHDVIEASSAPPERKVKDCPSVGQKRKAVAPLERKKNTGKKRKKVEKEKKKKKKVENEKPPAIDYTALQTFSQKILQRMQL